jgi:hypothetical protein
MWAKSGQVKRNQNRQPTRRAGQMLPRGNEPGTILLQIQQQGDWHKTMPSCSFNCAHISLAWPWMFHRHWNFIDALAACERNLYMQASQMNKRITNWIWTFTVYTLHCAPQKQENQTVCLLIRITNTQSNLEHTYFPYVYTLWSYKYNLYTLMAK